MHGAQLHDAERAIVEADPRLRIEGGSRAERLDQKRQDADQGQGDEHRREADGEVDRALHQPVVRRVDIPADGKADGSGPRKVPAG